jgi:hypothetical protein
MTPLRRRNVNKYKSAKSFRKQMRKTKAANMANPTRGGWRM